MPTYHIDLDKVILDIKKAKAKRVLLQLPNGLRPRAKELTDEIKTKTGCDVLLWLGSSYGACDLPQHLDKLGVDLTFHFGHSSWNR